MRLIASLALALSLTACGPIGMMTSKSEQYSTTDSFALAKSPANFVDTVTATGQSLGYTVSGVDRSKNGVMLSDGVGLGTGVLIGKMGRTALMVNLEGRTVKLSISALGNFGMADQTKVDERLRRFRDALQTRLR